MKKKIRLCILEAPNLADLFNDRRESTALTEVSRLIGQKTASFTVLSKDELTSRCRLIAGLTEEPKSIDSILFLHIAAHGNDECLDIGGESLPWDELYNTLAPVLNSKYSGKIVVIISACNASDQKLTQGVRDALKNKSCSKPPAYVFTSEGEPDFVMTVTGWALFYHRISSLSLDNIEEIQVLLKVIRESTHMNIKYFCWSAEDRKFKTYSASKKD